jgi:ureidoglycolate hydrolase
MTPHNRSGKPGVNIHRNYMHKPLRAIWAVTIGQPVSCPRDLIERLGR